MGTMSHTDKSDKLWYIDGGLFLDLVKVLNTNSAWKELLRVVPKRYTGSALLDSICNQKYNSTPSEVILKRWGTQGVKVSTFIRWLEASNLEKALILLKDDEPLIVEPLEPYMTVVEGSTLFITCRAKSFPMPDYRWYKGQKELLLQQQPQLIIPNISAEDSDVYKCRVFKVNQKSSQSPSDFVKEVQTCVTVIPQSHLLDPEDFDCSSSYPESEEGCSSISDKKSCSLSSQDISSPEVASTNGEDVQLGISDHPIGGKISQRPDVIAKLICRATSSHPISYQWFCDEDEIKGATSEELFLCNLAEDPVTGQTSWKYVCQVTAGGKTKLSRGAIVEVIKDDGTVFYATEKKALLFANDDYHSPNMQKLHLPTRDVATLASKLSGMDFDVTAFHNLDLKEMKTQLHAFCSSLKPGSYCVFYCAGHGFDLCERYLQPVDATDTDPEKSLSIQYVMQCIQEQKPALNLMLVDVCGTRPENNGSINHRSHSIFNPQLGKNCIVVYATCSLHSAHECRSAENGYFVKHLKNYIQQEKKVDVMLNDLLKAFENDPDAKLRGQMPFIKKSFVDRSLQDKISETQEISNGSLIRKASDLKWKKRIPYPISNIPMSIELSTCLHENIFWNEVDIKMYVEIDAGADISKVLPVGIYLNFPEDVKWVLVDISPPVYKTGFRTLARSVRLTDLQKFDDDIIGQVHVKHESGEYTQVFQLNNPTKLLLQYTCNGCF